MAKYYGYCYDEEGRFTEMIPLEEKAITEKQTFYREETKEIITKEKLCNLHQSIVDGTYKPDPENVEEPISKYDCPDCVMEHIEYETIKVPYEEDVIVGYEPDIPENCTLEAPIYADATWDGTVWIYDRDLVPPEPSKPPEPTPIEILNEKVELFTERMNLNEEGINNLKASLQPIENLVSRMTENEKDIDDLKSDFAVMTTTLKEVLYQLELGISSRRDVQKEPMNPEDLPNYDPSTDETPEPKQDLLALYLDPTVGKE